jgi:hypothetical protein
MLIWVLFLGLFTLFFGLLFIFAPKPLKKMSHEMNKMVQGVDTQVMSNRVVVGVVLVLLSLYLFYYAYTLDVR